MATLVCFHAHPDDESIATGGLMACAAARGHRVVLVVATRGEQGEVEEGVLADGESLGVRRERETRESAQILGAARVEFLGYGDSGMMGTATNDAPWCFWRADVEEAAERLAEILADEAAAVLTVYDDNGGYGHPDHIQVHRVGVRAAALARTPEVYEATMNRDEIVRMLAEARERGDDLFAGQDDDPGADGAGFGVPEAALTHRVDITARLAEKRASMRAHASQIAESSFFLAMPEDAFTRAFGVEWLTRRGATVPVDRFEPWPEGLS